MDREKAQIEEDLQNIAMPGHIRVRAWTEADFTAIQHLSTTESWLTPRERPVEALAAWQASWPALVLVNGAEVIGFLRALTDGQVTTYIAEILIAPEWRGQGLGQVLLEACHRLVPSTRLDLLSTESSDRFYEAVDFRRFQGFRKSYR